MQDHLAVDTDQQFTITPQPKPLQVRIARHVSNILAPSSISLPFIVLVALYHAQNVPRALLYALITLLFASVGPLFYILICVRLGKISDVDVSRRTERAGPFLFGITSVLAGWLALILLHGPRNLQAVLFITAMSGTVMMMITLWWKISIHASSMGGAATILTVFYGAVMLPTFLLLLLVSWSRVVLRRHTVLQVVVGSLLSIALTLLLLKYAGYNQ
ncbi:MAG TPA: phosphatase PAP2 family protein [Ktedonobacteraceae bacterium]|nr:phosphatase PAP2 family protein [Ktedonobacteraceae bacterium]